MNGKKFIFLLLTAAFLWGCSTTRALKDGEYMLRSNRIKVNDSRFNASSLGAYLSQKPNSTVLGFNPLLTIYNWGGQGESKLGQFFRTLGVAPVVYDPSQVDKSIENLQNHLRYIGYYDSQVESRVDVRGRKVFVNYFVTLGKRFKISAIDYDIPDYGTFLQDFDADLRNSTIAAGQYLSEANLEKEAERSAQYFRTKGYFGFTKSFYAFEADTLSGNGNARLKMSILNYALGDSPETAREHRKYHIGKVTIAHPEMLKIRPSVLENLNTIAPGQLYDEQAINTAYTRLSGISMLSSVNISMNPAANDLVDCSITLQNSALQGFKTNLEASVNSTGLIGISPQLSYFHRNLFHGGEVLNLGLKGNFQFKPKDTAYSTEVTVTSSLLFPQFLGIPNRMFKGSNIPRTEFNASFSYQDRPEFRRTLISTSLAYSGRVGNRFFYQFNPTQVNITRLFNVDDTFLGNLITNNPFLYSAYSDNFGLGIGGTLYYTTNSSTIPTTTYHYFRLNFDVVGNLLSLFNRWMPVNELGQHTIWDTAYSQYVRAEFQAGATFRFGQEDRHSIALRFLAGAGHAYGNSFSVPFEKQFYSGGSSSMRGWQARTLGPGNSTFSYSEVFAIPSQTGEMKLEANAEYRFPLIWKLEGALFADIGNVWELSTDTSYEGTFNLKTLPQSVGADWGLGIRLNLDFILVRLDGGFRVHDPFRAAGDRWLGPDRWFNGNNFALHFGVGYPF